MQAKTILRNALAPLCFYSRGLANFAYDFWRFMNAYNYKSNIYDMNKEQASAHLLRTMHSLEKGLALPKPLPGFGRPKALALLNDAGIYRRLYGEDRIYNFCIAVLKDYVAFQKLHGLRYPELDAQKLNELEHDEVAGVREISRQAVWEESRIDFRSFAYSRSSVRIFTGECVPEAEMLEAIDIARKSPSVCNRSCARAYYSNDPELMRRALQRQDGNRGFGELAGGLIMVAADNRAFHKIGERNQGWIDGGLFAMTLNYALHAMGYGVCMLNWSMGAREDYRFRRDFGIPSEHLIIMMMAIGHLPETFRVAVSPRRETSDFAIPFRKHRVQP